MAIVTYELLPQTGTSARTLGFVRALVERKHEVLVVGTIKDNARETALIESLGSRYVGALPVACKPGMLRSIVFASSLTGALSSVHSTFDFDLLHFANYNMNAIAFPLVRQAIRVPIVSDLHATISRDLESGLKSQSLIPWCANVGYERFMLTFSDGVTTPTMELKEFFEQRSKREVFQVFNCVRLPPNTSMANVEKSNWKTFFHANFQMNRSLHEFSRLNTIVTEVQKRGFRLDLLVAGPGSVTLDLGPSVTNLGYVKDPYDYLNKSDIVVLPVLDRSLGLHSRLVEAMATGRPIVASRQACCGLLTYLDESGIQVCDSTDQMVESICSLLRNPHRLTELGERNAQLARRLFSPEAVGKSLENAYERIMRSYRQRETIDSALAS